MIQYDRPKGRLVKFETFDNVQLGEAERLRLEIDLDLNRRRIEHEVVLLEATSEQALRRTHRRYFEKLIEMLT